MKRYTMILKNVCGKHVKTQHYENKRDLMEDTAYWITHGYMVQVMAYSVYVNNKVIIEMDNKTEVEA